MTYVYPPQSLEVASGSEGTLKESGLFGSETRSEIFLRVSKEYGTRCLLMVRQESRIEVYVGRRVVEDEVYPRFREERKEVQVDLYGFRRPNRYDRLLIVTVLLLGVSNQVTVEMFPSLKGKGPFSCRRSRHVSDQ